MKLALAFVALLAVINLSHGAYPVGYAQSSYNNIHRSDSYYRGLLRHLGDGQELDAAAVDDYSEEDDYKTDTTYSTGYRPTTTTEAPPPSTTEYQWQWRPCYDEQECYRQYIREFYRYHAYHDALQRGAVPPTTATAAPVPPTKVSPRLNLRSGDNVHFGEGINWSIYKTGEGLTRVGTRDGEVVVRVVRPNYVYERPDRRKAIHPYEDIKTRSSDTGSRRRPTTTEAPAPEPAPAAGNTPYQWQWQPCYNEQDCYRQYVNEYYRFYANNNQ